ncbi:MAG: EAL domain-containing protein [Aquificaceae bacterium]|nr:EAL domain-containing protein [Aquificaceae bacterium]
MLPTLRKIEKEIFEAIERRDIEVFFQDILNIRTYTVEGFEALMRLRINNHLLPATYFVNRAEELGIIRDLDRVMVERIFQRLSSIDISELFFFINLSPQNLTEDYMRWVINMVEKYGIKPSRIVFEITEREAIQDIVEVSRFIKNIRNLGFKFAIDDFGSGYASFLYLKYLHVDFLKIEGEFIKSLKDSMIDRSFVRSIVDIAKTLGIKTIAEQVEDEETLNILLSLGVDYAQGYYIGRPAPMEEKIKAYFSKETDQ